VWRPRSISEVSYPDEGNNVCRQIEDDSFWFRHRNALLLRVMKRLHPEPPFFDIGGGNGFVSLAIQNAGTECVLLEPGSGAVTGKQRGLRNVIQSTLIDAGLDKGVLPSAGAFDVVEHIEGEQEFLRSIKRSMVPGGRFFCTVPAFNTLWSDDDIYAGHYRRYSRRTLREAMENAGFKVEYMTYFFSWLVPAIFLTKSLPFRIRGDRSHQLGQLSEVKSDHSLPGLIKPVVDRIHARELRLAGKGSTMLCGSSLLCVATA